MADNNLTPIEILNIRYKNLVGRSYEELIAESSERFSKHKEQLLAYLERPDEIRAYLDAHRFDSALAFAVTEVDGLLHSDKDEQGRYKTPHKEYCQKFKSYTKKFFVWDNIQQYLQSLNDTKSQIIYLICLKTEIESQKDWWRYQYDRDFNLSELCGFELSKLEAQLMLEQNKEKLAEESDKKKKSGNDSDISKELRAAIIKAHTNLLEAFEADDERAARKEKIVKETINYLRTNPDSVTFDKILIGLGIFLKNKPVDLQISHAIFKDVQEWFGLGLAGAKESGTQKEIGRVEFMYNCVPSIARDFFEEVFLEELQEIDLAEQVRTVKKWLGMFSERHYPFICDALKKIQAEIEPEEKAASDEKGFSLRVKILLFLALTYNKLELPIELQPAKAARSFMALTGETDFDRIRKILAKPTAHIDSIKSKKPLITDLRIVQTQIEALRLTDNLRTVVGEINELLTDLEEMKNPQSE